MRFIHTKFIIPGSCLWELFRPNSVNIYFGRWSHLIPRQTLRGLGIYTLWCLSSFSEGPIDVLSFFWRHIFHLLHLHVSVRCSHWQYIMNLTLNLAYFYFDRIFERKVFSSNRFLSRQWILFGWFKSYRRKSRRDVSKKCIFVERSCCPRRGLLIWGEGLNFLFSFDSQIFDFQFQVFYDCFLVKYNWVFLMLR